MRIKHILKYWVILLPVVIIIWLVFISIEKDSSDDIEIPLSELQSIIQSEALLHESIFQSDAGDIRKSVYELSSLIDTHWNNFEEFLRDFLNRNYYNANTEDFYMLQELTLAIARWEVSIENFIDVLYESFWIILTQTDVSIFIELWLQYLWEKNIHHERLNLYIDTLWDEYQWGIESIVDSIITMLVSEQWEISDGEIATIRNNIYNYFTSDTYTFSLQSFYDFILELWNQYDVVLDISKLSKQYIETQKIYLVLQETETKFAYQNDLLQFSEYEKTIIDFSQEQESLSELLTFHSLLETEEFISYITKELDYWDVTILLQERSKNTWELWTHSTSYFDTQWFKDDSEIRRDMSAIAYISELNWIVVVENLLQSTSLASTNTLLYAGYKISTWEDSEAVIIFEDDSLLRLDANSSVSLIWEARKLSWVRVNYGKTWTRVLKPFLSWERFEIEGNGVSLWVRGTSIYMQVSESESDIYIVDSFSTENYETSVELTHKKNMETSEYWAWRRIQLDHNLDELRVSSMTRTAVLTTHPQVWRFIRDDLHYMSVLLDDKERGFINTALEKINLSDTVISKIIDEIVVSIPSQNEKSRIFSNIELTEHPISANISIDNIYELTLKDRLIDELKYLWWNNIDTLIQNILGTDIESILEIRWNKRSLEKRIESWAITEMIERNIPLSVLLTQDEETSLEDIRRRLHQALMRLTLPWWLQRITWDIVLPSKDEVDTGISIKWKLPQYQQGIWDQMLAPYYLTTDPESQKQILKVEQEILGRDYYDTLQATLSLGTQTRTKYIPFILPSRDYTHLEKLEMSAKKLTQHIEMVSIFSDTIHTPDFHSSKLIIPEIKWIDNNSEKRIDADWSIKQASAELWDIMNYKVSAKLRYRDAEILLEDIVLKKIVSLPELPEFTGVGSKLADSQYPWCDTADIILPNGQVWAMCNVWSSISWLGKDSYGNYLWYNKARGICAPWYRAPNRSDWMQARDEFHTFSQMTISMQLPKWWYIQEHMIKKDTIKHQWKKSYYWTREKKSWCTSNCWYAFSDWRIRRMKADWHKMPVRCIRNERHDFEMEIHEFLEMQM